MRRTRQIREILLAIVDLYREKNGDSLSQWLAGVKNQDFSPTILMCLFSYCDRDRGIQFFCKLEKGNAHTDI